MRHPLLLLATALLLGGCYHATINTGIAPGARQVNRAWAKSFVYGLVPPENVEAMEACGAAGVARVETQHSFLNGLVAGITFGIFTPMTLTVTCGTGTGDDEGLTEVSTAEEFQKALADGGAFLVPVSRP